MSLKLSEDNKSPGRKPNDALRPREYLTLNEVWTLIKAARYRKGGRTNIRDAVLIELLYRHGLRASEIVNLRWSDINFVECTIQVARSKNGLSGIHPINIDEFKTLRNLKQKNPGQAFVFTAEGGGPINRRTVWDVVKRAGEAANFPFPIHPHMLRHAKGYNLVNRGKDIRVIASYLGHKSIDSTMRYTQLNHQTLKTFADDND